jgi:hypothetical protein
LCLDSRVESDTANGNNDPCNHEDGRGDRRKPGK